MGGGVRFNGRAPEGLACKLGELHGTEGGKVLLWQEAAALRGRRNAAVGPPVTARQSGLVVLVTTQDRRGRW